MAVLDRSYPSDLAERVREGWPADARALPELLEPILDAAYHASFLLDEERPVTCRILVCRHASCRPTAGPPGALLPLVFATPRAFDEHELGACRRRPGRDRALVGVDESRGELVTWGIVQSGPRWLQVAQGGRANEPPLPPCLVVRVVRPGHLIVGCGSRLDRRAARRRAVGLRARRVPVASGCPSCSIDARLATATEHPRRPRRAARPRVAARLSQYVEPADDQARRRDDARHASRRTACRRAARLRRRAHSADEVRFHDAPDAATLPDARARDPRRPSRSARPPPGTHRISSSIAATSIRGSRSSTRPCSR